VTTGTFGLPLALARVPFARVRSGAAARIVTGAWAALAFAIAFAAHARGAAHGADIVLVDTVGALVVPLLAYGLVASAVGGRSLASAGAPLVAFGALPSQAALTTVAVAAAASALAGALVAAGVAVIAHGTADPSRATDALASAYAGALGGAAYAGWFSLGATFGERGGGRALFLLVDWTLGSAGGAALVTPRGHLRNLLGGAAPQDLSGRASSLALILIACACAVLAARRVRT
jgi:hypothetical protein